MWEFPHNVYLLSFFAAFGLALAGLPVWRNWCRSGGLVDDPGRRKIHEEPIPLAGGLTVLSAMLLPILAGCLALFLKFFPPETVSLLKHGYEARLAQLLAILAGAAGMCALGWADDKYELRPLAKFSGQFLIAGVVAASGIRITLFVDNLLFSYAVTILWIVTLVNALNFMDNMNGLCAGLGLIASLAFALASGLAGQYLVTSLALLTAGALAGFLPYNFPRATAFLGDSGSHLVGFLLAVLAILTTFYSPEELERSPWAVVSPLLILSIPLADLVMVVIIRRRLGKPFYVGDTNHLSHRLVRKGLSQKNAVLLIWLLAGATAGLSFLI